MTLDAGLVEEHTDAKTLVVLLHAYTSNPTKLGAVKRAVDDAIPNAEVWVPKLPAGTLSFADPDQIAIDLVKKIDDLWNARKGYEKIIFVGHSLGGLLARKAYILACGDTEESTFDQNLKSTQPSFAKPREWASCVERIILLAGMNRGWRLNHHLSIWRAAAWRVGGSILTALSIVKRRTPLILSIRKGSPFITQMRIQWIAMQNANQRNGLDGAITVQLLGSIDDLVAPEDNIDLASGMNFIYLDVPYSGHGNVIDLDDASSLPSLNDSNADETIGAARSREFTAALIDSLSELKRRAVIPPPSELPEGSRDPAIDEVVFVIHGIRDVGYWTHKIARSIIRRANSSGHSIKIATETSSYGYFPMLPFLMPGQRNAKVEWLMDQYSEAKAIYPNAKFSFVGHSNGTYLFAKALEQYPSCRFERAVFVGSVVHRNYRWGQRIESGQIKRVLNVVASRDWVVAFFPKALQMLGLQDLGSAGHDGFAELKTYPQDLAEIRYVNGGHSAGLSEKNWPAIADFILGEDDVNFPSSSTVQSSNCFVTLPGYVAPILWILLGTVIVGLGALLWKFPQQEWQKTLLVTAYTFGLWKVITSF